MDQKLYKQELLNQLYAPYKKCLKCPLGNLGRTNVVFGHGNPDATLMFIGEGPGKDEDEQGIPFVGRSGKLLNRIFETIGITRNDVFISNIVKCRPPNNRKPLPLEIKTCKKLLLLKQIQIIHPRVICTLGAAALEGLIEQKVKITQMRGTPIKTNLNNTPQIIIPAYHPAYILRNSKNLQILVNDITTAYKKSIIK